LVICMPLKVGDRAPDFELYDTEFRLVRLSDSHVKACRPYG
jgi:peroxiredoxin